MTYLHPTPNKEIWQVTTVSSSPYNVTDMDRTIIVDTSGDDITVNMPAASSNNGRIIVIKKTSALNTLTVDGDSSDLVDGAATLLMTALNAMKYLQCDGTEWHIVN